MSTFIHKNFENDTKATSFSILVAVMAFFFVVVVIFTYTNYLFNKIAVISIIQCTVFPYVCLLLGVLTVDDNHDQLIITSEFYHLFFILSQK